MIKKKIRRKSNPELIELVHFLKKQSEFWQHVAELLARPKRKTIEVNLNKINKLTKDNSTVVIPGKVLSDGEISKPLTIAAFSFSDAARQKLRNSKLISIDELAKMNKKGEGIIIIL